jgi:hypothetical protein
MNPYPFASLNHFTTPVAICFPSRSHSPAEAAHCAFLTSPPRPACPACLAGRRARRTAPRSLRKRYGIAGFFGQCGLASRPVNGVLARSDGPRRGAAFGCTYRGKTPCLGAETWAFARRPSFKTSTLGPAGKAACCPVADSAAFAHRTGVPEDPKRCRFHLLLSA